MVYRAGTPCATEFPDPAVLGLLPGWLPWLPLVVYSPAAFVVAVAAAAVAAAVALGVRPRLAERGWVDRARVGWPARRAIATIAWPCVAYGAMALGAKRTAGVPDLVAAVQVPAVLVATYAGIGLVSNVVERGMRAGQATRRWWRDAVIWMLLQPSFLIAIGALWLGPEKPDALAFVTVTLIAALCVTMDAGLRVARVLGLARPASARLRAIVDRVAGRAGIRPRRAYELAMRAANAVALPVSGTICVTDGLLAVLEDDAAASVVAHELGHLGDHRTLRPMTAAGILAPPAVLATRLVSSQTILWSIAAGWVGLMVALRRLQKRRELHADDAARAATDDPATYARALERLYEVGVVPVVGSRSTHPDLYDRMLASGVAPAYPRPPRPSRVRMVAATIAGMVVAFAGFQGLAYAPWVWRAARPVLVAANLAVLSLDPHDSWALRELADARHRHGDSDGAAALYGVLESEHPGSAYWAARHAFVLAVAGRCPQARDAAQEALHRGRCKRCGQRARRVLRHCEGSPSTATAD